MNALAGQEGDISWEVVVVLDGDIDGSRAVLDQFLRRAPLTVVELSENQGRSAALNAGFHHSGGSVLIRCDDDLVPTPDFIARHAAHHNSDAVGVVGLYRNVFPDTVYARVYGRAWDEDFRREAYAAPAHRTWRYWAGNCSLTRATWDSIGPYDTGFRAYGYEDVDFGYRVASLGVPIVLDRQLETEHRIAATTTSTRAQRAFYSGAARRRFESKHGLTPPDPVTRTAWDRAVAALARRLDERRTQTFGSVVDASARVLPARAGRKAVAMLVEAAARAGHASGQTQGDI